LGTGIGMRGSSTDHPSGLQKAQEKQQIISRKEESSK
jgi:hypothetical protein